MKAIEVKAGMTVKVQAPRADGTYGPVTVKVTLDVRHFSEGWNQVDDVGVYIYGARDDGATWPVWIYDLAEVELVES